MSAHLERITEEVLSLPAPSRAKLARKLLESLDEPDAAKIEERWAEEAERRCGELDQGRVVRLSGPEVLRELRAKVR